MSWKDRAARVKINGRNLIAGSFRGVPFFVESVTTRGGRRVEVHEFPGGEEQQIEDLGKIAGRFSVSGYVVGANYDADKFELQEALDAGGAGTLQLPSGRKLSAFCEEYSVTETRDEGGFAAFSLSFHAASGDRNGPKVKADALGKLQGAVAGANDALAAASNFSISGLSNELLGPVETAIDKVLSSTPASLGALTSGPQDLAAMRQKLDIMGGKLSSLARSPLDLFEAYKDAIDLLLEAPNFATLKLSKQNKQNVKEEAPASPFITKRRTKQKEAFDAAVDTLSRTAMIKKVEAAGSGGYEFYSDAIDARAILIEEIEEETENAGGDLAGAFANLKAALIDAIPGDQSLKNVDTFAPILTEPSLVLSHDLYGVADRSDEIEERNGIAHPLFVGGGQDLQVVVDD